MTFAIVFSEFLVIFLLIGVFYLLSAMVNILIARLTHYWFIISNEGQRKRRSGSVERDLCQQMLYFNCQTPIEGLNLNNGFLEIKSCPSVTLSKLDLTSEI